jgi:hypothetical protein
LNLDRTEAEWLAAASDPSTPGNELVWIIEKGSDFRASLAAEVNPALPTTTIISMLPTHWRVWDNPALPLLFNTNPGLLHHATNAMLSYVFYRQHFSTPSAMPELLRDAFYERWRTNLHNIMRYSVLAALARSTDGHRDTSDAGAALIQLFTNIVDHSYMGSKNWPDWAADIMADVKVYGNLNPLVPSDDWDKDVSRQLVILCGRVPKNFFPEDPLTPPWVLAPGTTDHG